MNIKHIGSVRNIEMRVSRDGAADIVVNGPYLGAQGGADAMAYVLSAILPDFPPRIRRFAADVTHECDACGEHARCATVNDESFCELCFRSLAADAERAP